MAIYKGSLKRVVWQERLVMTVFGFLNSDIVIFKNICIILLPFSVIYKISLKNCESNTIPG